MKKFIILFLLLIFCNACAHGITRSFPEIENETYSKITIFRNMNLVGGGCNVILTLDMATIAYMATGEYLTFYLEPGKHRIGIAGSTCGGHSLWEQAYNFEAKNEYFFLIGVSTRVLGFDYEQISKGEAEKWLKNPQMEKLDKKMD